MKPAVLSVFLLSMLPVWLVGCVSAPPTPTATPAPTPVPTTTPSPTPVPLTLQLVGNACTLLTAPDGTRIVSDPYGYSRPAGLRLLPENLEADAVTVSHKHPDHNNVKAVGGEPQVITEPGAYQVGAVKVTGYESREGSPTGPSATMRNVVFVFEVGGAKIVHLGDGGPIVEPEILAAVEGADVVLVNIDGYVFPLDEILPHMQRIGARTIIPTHYSLSERARWVGAPTVDEFLKTLPADVVVVREEGSEVQIASPMPKQMIVLTPLMLDKQYLDRLSRG